MEFNNNVIVNLKQIVDLTFRQARDLYFRLRDSGVADGACIIELPIPLRLKDSTCQIALKDRIGMEIASIQKRSDEEGGWLDCTPSLTLAELKVVQRARLYVSVKRVHVTSCAGGTLPKAARPFDH